MKKLFYSMIFLIVLISNDAMGQGVGIGIIVPDASAKLDITDTARGILIPRMTTVQRNAIAAPANGLLVFVTSDSSFYYFKNGWKKLIAANEGWGLSGNAGTNSTTDFIGTTDATPLKFKVGNINTGQINQLNDNVGFGFRTFDSITTGDNNNSLGSLALQNNTSGDANIALGTASLNSNKDGNFNVSSGYASMIQNLHGSYNTAIGAYSLNANKDGNLNVSSGYASMAQNLHGSNNTVIGSYTGFYSTDWSNCTLIGTLAQVTRDSLINATAIGFNATVSESNCLVLGGTGGSAVNVGIGVTGPKEKLIIGGAVTISAGAYTGLSNNDTTPAPAGGTGTMVFSNGHFFGWNGTQWKQLDN